MEPVLICPNCSETMEQRRLERYDGAEIIVDACFRCHVIWFDRMESTQLAPIAVLDADAVERAANALSERAEQRAKRRAAAERAVAGLRNMEKWNYADRSDLLMDTIAMLDALRKAR